MIISNWNIRGWTCDKADYVLMLTRQSTVLCLTEVWHPPEKRPNGIFTLAPPDENRYRRGGGVALLVPDGINIRHLRSLSHSKYQLLSASCLGLVIVAVYISPTIEPSQFQECLEHIRHMAQGSAIVVGDFNARHTTWDTATNRYGLRFSRWAAKCNFKVAAPCVPTCYTTRGGSSTVDLLLYRALVASPPETGSFSCKSDHRPVHTAIALSTPASVDTIPLSLIQNVTVQQRIVRDYNSQIPPIVQKIQQAKTPVEIETASKQLAAKIVEPWARFRKPRPDRYRPGWTASLDKMAKQRTKLLKQKENPQRRVEAQMLDRKIKREFRRNRRQVLNDLCESLEGSSPGREATITSQILTITREKPGTTPRLNANDFQEFMASLQDKNALTIDPVKFFTPPSFTNACEMAIAQSKKKKSPGPCKIRSEMISLIPELFGRALSSLWSAIGRVGYMPTVMRSATYAPIFKSGDSDVPSNYRPISLTSILRRTITTALLPEITKHAPAHRNQWGFQRGSNTECALAFVAQKQREGLSRAAVLDLKKAYDMVPRYLLLQLVRKRLPTNVANMVQCLLVPSMMRTKGQTQKTHFLATLGVPQGDPPSPALFNIFMDEFLDQTNTLPTAVSSCVADDITILSSTDEGLQKQLDTATKWGHESSMHWAILKSFQIGSSSDFVLNSHLLQQANEAPLLGTTISAQGITHTRLLLRISDAMKRMSQLSRHLKKWRLTHTQKRNIVKIFVFSVVDYVLYLHPVTGAVKQAAQRLERMAAAFVLGCRIPQKQTTRAVLLAGLLPFEQRRLLHMLNAVKKFTCQALSEPTNTSLQHKLSLITSFPTVSTALQQFGYPVSLSNVDQWYKDTQEKIRNDVSIEANRHQRKLPRMQAGTLPPVLRSHVSPSAKHKSLLWYFNNLEMRDERKRNMNLEIKAILESSPMTEEMEHKLEEILNDFELIRVQD